MKTALLIFLALSLIFISCASHSNQNLILSCEDMQENQKMQVWVPYDDGEISIIFVSCTDKESDEFISDAIDKIVNNMQKWGSK